MTGGIRSNTRSPGRTPPFILVGLLIIVGILGYSYWSLSSTNSELAAELESVQAQKKDIDQINSEAEKNLESAREELRTVQGNLEQVRKQLQDKDSELSGTKTDLASKQADADKFKNQLSQCDTSLAEQKSSLETLKNEKGELERQLNEAKQKQVVCDLAACSAPVKDILTIAAKLIGSEAIGKALSEANLDAAKLLEGIQFPAPVIQQPNNAEPQAQKQQQDQQPQGQNQPPQVQNQPVADLQAANANQQGNENEHKDDTEISSSINKAARNLDRVIQVDKGSKGDLAFQSERDQNIAEISKLFAFGELRKQPEKQIDELSKDSGKNQVDETDEGKADVKEANTYDEDEAEKDVREA